MSDLFNLAAKRALQMSQPSPQKISINIEICQPSEGGLSSIQKGMDISGEPHKLAYINSDESSLLKAIGGQGEPMEGTNGIPAYSLTSPNMIAELIKQQQEGEEQQQEGKRPGERDMAYYLRTFASRDQGKYPRFGPEGDVLERVYSGDVEERFKNPKFLARLFANLEKPYPEKVTDEEEKEVVVETA
tara:strand:- start:1255 stop:1818 length:564 start_codon:yes stop_codon:yes gene_type:complete